MRTERSRLRLIWKVRDSLEIYEAETNQTFGLHSQWVVTGEAGAGGISRELTIEDTLWDRRETVWVSEGTNLTGSFYIGTEQELSQIDWNSGLFR